VPNAGDQCKRIDYRVKEWDWDFLCFIKTLEKKKSVILAGDLNVAHWTIDIYEAEYLFGNPKIPGVTP